MYNILICDDDRDIVAALKIYLTAEGYHTFEAYNGNDALGIIARETIHLVLLDTDKVLGLSIGADDYITKPFNPMEVLARVRSQLRRYTMLGGMHGMEKKPSIISIDGVEIDDEAKTVTVDGEPVNLTPIEYSILKLLMEHAGKVFSSARIYELVWKDPAWGAENTVAVHIRHIREKLEINPAEPRYLKVVWGQGYKFEQGCKGKQ